MECPAPDNTKPMHAHAKNAAEHFVRRIALITGEGLRGFIG
jgi:hypothetical protein